MYGGHTLYITGFRTINSASISFRRHWKKEINPAVASSVFPATTCRELKKSREIFFSPEILLIRDSRRVASSIPGGRAAPDTRSVTRRAN